MSAQVTEQSIKSIMWADAEARRRVHDYICTEHLLLGLIDEGTSVAAKILKNLGLDRTSARSTADRLIDKGEQKVDGILPFSVHALKVLSLAGLMAQSEKAKVAPKHILLAIIDENKGGATSLLKEFDVDVVKLQRLLLVERPDESSEQSQRLVASELMLSAVPNLDARGKIFERHHFRNDGKENDFGTRQECTIVHSRRGGYSVILANGKEAFLHSQKKYISDDHVDVMILLGPDPIIVTDEEKFFCATVKHARLSRLSLPNSEFDDKK
jgi:hypothetical protein